MTGVKQRLGTVYRGLAPKRTHLKYMMISLILFAFGVIVAIGLFPVPYTPLNNHISDMGGIASNPAAWGFFDASIIVVGILMIPHFVYLYRRLMPTTKWLTRLAMLSGVVGCIGFSILGMFPEDIPAPHDLAANLAFGGLGGAAFLTMFILLRKMKVKAPWPSWKAFLILYGPLFVAIPFVIIIPNLDPIPGIDPRWFTWPPWQWTSMLSLLHWLIITALIVPEIPATQPVPLN